MSPIETSIIILSKDRYGMIKECLRSLMCLNQSTLEVIVGDTGSSDAPVFELYDDFGREFKGRFQLIAIDQYHFSKNNNWLAIRASGTSLVFLNNDTRGIGDWLSPLTHSLALDNVGIAGSKLLYGHHRRIQHAGVEFLKSGELKYLGYHPYKDRHPLMPEINFPKWMPAVTGACLAIQADLFRRAGGFGEHYAEEAQDVDLCLKVQQLGLRCRYEPQSTLFHFENGTRPRLSEHRKDRTAFIRTWKRTIDASFFQTRFQSEPADPEMREQRKTREFVFFKRQRARGDVLASTSLLRAFKQRHPNTHVTYSTDYPELIDALPFIDRVLHTRDYDDYRYDRVLQLTYENGEWRKYPHTWIEEMGRGIGIPHLADYRPQVEFSAWDTDVVGFYESRAKIKPYVVLATGAGWKEREWENSEWDGLATTIREQGYDVFQIGSSHDHWVRQAFHVLDRSLHENLAILRGAKALVTVDSFPYHLGSAIGLPIFLLTCKSCTHTTWAGKNVTEIRHHEADWTPLPGCRNLGCRQKFGEGLENRCDSPILKFLPYGQVWQHLEPYLKGRVHA